MTLTRRGLFGLIGAAAAGSAVSASPKVITPAQARALNELPPLTEEQVRVLCRKVVEHLPREIAFIGAQKP